MPELKPKVIVITGPTASGKTALSVKLAKTYNGEVISADSMQIYKHMNIGTAKPSKDEMDGIPHHLIDFLDPDQTFSVAMFVEQANKIADQIISRGKIPIICGGTGLYISSFVENLRFSGNSGNEQLREKLFERIDREGSEKLLEELSVYDALSAAKLHSSDKIRIVRALELAVSGLTLTKQNELSKQEIKYDTCIIGLTSADRGLLYNRINQRVDQMMKSGLIEEAKTLYGRYSKTAAQAIGYKELFSYFNGEQTLQAATEKIKQGSRNYAKRQLTWLRCNPLVNWVYTDRIQSNENIFKICIKILEIYGMI